MTRDSQQTGRRRPDRGQASGQAARREPPRALLPAPASLLLLGLLGLLGLLLGWPGSGYGQEQPDDQPVGLELLLAVDGSASIDSPGLAFQILGHAAAFQALADTRPELLAGPGGGGMAVALAVWSGPGNFVLWQPWRMIRSGADASAFAVALAERATAAETLPADSTAIGAALDQGMLALQDNGYIGERQVIDLVSNGFSNAGIAPEEARLRAELLGITINALVIPDEFPWLERYFMDSVIAGPDAFVVSVESGADFVGSLLRKLVREMAQAIPVPPPSPAT